MSILYDDDHRAIEAAARRVLDEAHDPARLLALIETVGDHDAAFWDLCVAQGWTGMTIAEAQGGLGLGLSQLGLVTQAIGAYGAGAPFLTTGYGAGIALARGEGAGSELLPAIAAGSAKATVAFAERDGYLPATSRCVIEEDRLSGTKPAVTAGLTADFAVVLATMAGEPALAVVDLAGVERRAIPGFDNGRLIADLEFTQTPARVIARGEPARRMALDVAARMAVAVAYEQVGGAERLMLTARDHAMARKAFGQPIGAFQSVKHRIAELYVLVELARANCIHAASCEGTPDFLAAAASARLSATEAYDVAARDTVQIHGGIGVTWESGLHLHMRRARTLATETGNMLFWEDVLVCELTGAGR